MHGMGAMDGCDCPGRISGSELVLQGYVALENRYDLEFKAIYEVGACKLAEETYVLSGQAYERCREIIDKEHAVVALKLRKKKEKSEKVVIYGVWT